MMTLVAMTAHTKPCVKQIVVKVYSPRKQSCEIVLYSLDGRRVLTYFSDAIKGLNQVHFDTRDIEPSVYLVKTSLYPDQAVRIEVHK